MAGKRALATTQPRCQAMTNDVSMWQMLRAAKEMARAARAMVNEGGR